MLLCLLISLSAISAGDIDDVNVVSSSSNAGVVGVSADDADSGNATLQASGDSEVLTEENTGNFNDLNTLIQGTENGGTLSLDKNYVYDSASDTAFNSGIIISKTITIDGKGYIINGSSGSHPFKINADNVVLNNITFVDFNNLLVFEGDVSLQLIKVQLIIFE